MEGPFSVASSDSYAVPASSSTSPSVCTPSDASDSVALGSPLLEALEAGGVQRQQAVEALRGTMLRRSLDAEGCREVQVAFQHLDSKTSSELLRELHGSVFTLSKSSHGNYVMQKVVEVMPAAQVSFIAAELKGCAVKAAKHRHACRVLCRLLEHASDDAALAELMDELLVQAEDLCRHPFAHHVLETLVEQGLPQHQHRVCQALRANALQNAADRRGSFVVEAALRNCSVEDVQSLAQALLGGAEGSIVELAQTRFGAHIFRTLLKSPGASAAAASELLQNSANRLWETKHGRRLLEEASVIPLALAHAAPAA